MESPAPTPTTSRKPKHKLISLQQLDFALSRLGVDTHVTSDDIFKVLDEEESKQGSELPRKRNSKQREERPPQYPGLQTNGMRTPRRSQSTPTPGTSERKTSFTGFGSPPGDANRDDLRRELVLDNAEEAISEGADSGVDPYITMAAPL